MPKKNESYILTAGDPAIPKFLVIDLEHGWDEMSVARIYKMYLESSKDDSDREIAASFVEPLVIAARRILEREQS